MKKHGIRLLGSLIVTAIAVCCCLTVVHASNYHDVSDNDWHTEAIEYVREVGLMEGTGNGNFQPDQQLTNSCYFTSTGRKSRCGIHGPLSRCSDRCMV